jgi:peptide/nickel transport system substrate-binding protein
MSEIRCSQCNALNRDTARYCAECGTPLLTNLSSSERQRSAPEPKQDHEISSETGGEFSERILIGRYRLDMELGRGGFGAVYSAWDINLNHRCAVKENLEVTPEAQRQFSREATILANLTHPNLPRVTDHFSVPDQGQYLVMDFVEGEDLLSLVSRQGKQPVRQVLEWVTQVADALVYLHAQNPPVLHRDIKPANIRITPKGEATLVDFGLVKIYSPQLKTTVGARAVTPGYAPPEQYGQGMTDARTDIYALGATIYNLLTGVHPLESVLRAVGSKMMTIREINPEVPNQVEAVVDRAMALDPTSRFQTAVELKEALDKSLAEIEQPVLVARSPVQYVAPTMQMQETAGPLAQVEPLPSEKAPLKRKPPWKWIGLAGLVLISLVGLASFGGYYLIKGLSPARTPTTQARYDQPTLSAPVESVKVSPTSPPPLPAFQSRNPEVYIHLASSDPDTLDPALDYEPMGQQIITNIYDSLIFYRRENPNEFVPQLAVGVPSLDNGGISDEGRTYRFIIRPDVHFHNGALLTADDVAYTFQRYVLQGGSNSPQWLFTEPLFGAGIYDVTYLIDPGLEDQPAELSKVNQDQLMDVCMRVKEAIQADNRENVVIFRLAQPWSPFLATLATGYGSIQSKEWVIQNGGWDGDCGSWARFYGRSLDQINRTGLGATAMGTGPYLLDHWEPGKEIVLRANENYWRVEPAWDGGPFGSPSIKEVFIRNIADFETRFAQLQTGEVDSIDIDLDVPWSELDQIVGLICSLNDRECEPSDNPDGPIELVRGGPSVRRSDIFFTWQINTDGGNEFIGSGRLNGDGIPPDFFSNIHVRRAFAFCFNYERYLLDYLHGEGIRTINVMLPGMIGYNADTPHYNFDPQSCEDELHQAEFDGRSVWDEGFRMVIPINSGSIESRIMAETLSEELAARNNRIKIEIPEIESVDYYAQRREGRLPIFLATWLEDIHDPHNWLVPYTVSSYGRYQHFPPDFQNELENLVTSGVSAVDPPQRVEIYRHFNELYFEQVPAILLFSSIDRHYQQRWVDGWYDNPIYPGLYFYVLRKE